MEIVGDEAAAGESTQGAAKRGRGGVKKSGDVEEAWGQPPQAGATAASSRIYRVKASGGKDRHSKVCTTKGIRDRRVRLSVPTAIQLYDLQDRLGYDQPSKVVEWLINAASASIDELPALDPASFAPVPEQDAGKVMQQQQASKSSTSETSKGSELSLSRSDARDKEVTVASASAQAASFTELLTGVASAGNVGATEPWQPTPVSAAAAAADCVGVAHPGKGDQGVSTYAISGPTVSSFGNAPPTSMVPAQPFNFTSSAQMTRFSLVQDALAAGSSPAGDYSGLDFPMSSGFLGASRGTLQSNSQPQFSGQHHPLHQLDGPSPPFLYEHAATQAARPASENRLTATAALQLWNGFRQSGMKEKSRN